MSGTPPSPFAAELVRCSDEVVELGLEAGAARHHVGRRRLARRIVIATRHARIALLLERIVLQHELDDAPVQIGASGQRGFNARARGTIFVDPAGGIAGTCSIGATK